MKAFTKTAYLKAALLLVLAADFSWQPLVTHFQSMDLASQEAVNTSGAPAAGDTAAKVNTTGAPTVTTNGGGGGQAVGPQGSPAPTAVLNPQPTAAQTRGPDLKTICGVNLIVKYVESGTPSTLTTTVTIAKNGQVDGDKVYQFSQITYGAGLATMYDSKDGKAAIDGDVTKVAQKAIGCQDTAAKTDTDQAKHRSTTHSSDESTDPDIAALDKKVDQCLITYSIKKDKDGTKTAVTHNLTADDRKDCMLQKKLSKLEDFQCDDKESATTCQDRLDSLLSDLEEPLTGLLKNPKTVAAGKADVDQIQDYLNKLDDKGVFDDSAIISTRVAELQDMKYSIPAKYSIDNDVDTAHRDRLACMQNRQSPSCQRVQGDMNTAASAYKSYFDQISRPFGDDNETILQQLVDGKANGYISDSDYSNFYGLLNSPYTDYRQILNAQYMNGNSFFGTGSVANSVFMQRNTYAQGRDFNLSPLAAPNVQQVENDGSCGVVYIAPQGCGLSNASTVRGGQPFNSNINGFNSNAIINTSAPSSVNPFYRGATRSS
jgi:hypothetical protein